MRKETRKAVIAGNWKMNMTPSQAKTLIEELKPLVAGKNGCEVIVCVPFVDLTTAVEAVKGSDIKVGAQNVHFADKGAYTGEISAAMLKEVGAEYVVIGHSERRQYFGETDVTVNQRVTAAVRAGLKPILCVGELLEQRDQGITAEIVSLQTKIALSGITAEEMKQIIIAYEPVWAIGTGRTATAEQAEEVCAVIRDVLKGLYGEEIAEAVTVQYGGSMKPGNAAELLAKTNVDGGLIGGASLVAKDFAAIVDAAN
ncbi:MAG: triose-phosphate isomerase [Lachnospiraceae bacterium]|nr:triose-phosphate isomerase [Lachnospiraceae bacterium]